MGTTDATMLLEQIAQRLERIESALALPARPERWQPLSQAATQLGYSSGRTLLRAIREGRIPPRFVVSERSASGQRRRTQVDVEGFRQSIRSRG
jgi:hypothetical protein